MIQKIEKAWVQNFKKSDLVKIDKYDAKLGRSLYFGFNDREAPSEFQEGFREFNDNFHFNDLEHHLDQLLKYLHFIGITIRKETITNVLSSGKYSYQQILKKAFYIFKQLANYNDELDINNPYFDNRGDLLFFSRIEAENYSESTQLTLFDEIELPDLYNKYINLPDGYENNIVAKNLFNKIENTNDSYFITGKAGTGKSTFIHYFTKETKKRVLLLAFTGIATINIGGQTIHSFFRFPFKPLLPNDPDIPIFKELWQKRKILEAVDTIIIDEVSMLRSDILEGIDYSIRQNGGKQNLVFGGKQMIFVGDMFQLPPVVIDDNGVEKELFSIIYNSEYFFDSLAFKKLDPKFFEFDKVHRQDDSNFISLLNKVRDCTIDSSGIEKINQRTNTNYTPNIDDFVVTLTTTNRIANNENKRRLEELPYKSFYYKATIIGDFKEDRYPTLPILELKRNSQVMFVKNDSNTNERRWVNGTIAKIDFLTDDKIEIELKNGDNYTVEKETWENRKYQWDKNKNRITSKVIGTFEQYPLKLAWAVTIHKSQGLTFDSINIDLGTGAFVNGQLYTALSRCRTLDGIILKRSINSSDIIEDPRLIKFHNKYIQKKIKE